MSKSRMAGDKLKDIKFEDGLSSLPEGYDKGVANRVISGSWGEDDLKRYQHRMREGEAGKHSYTPYKDSDSSDSSSSSSSSSSAGSNDSANFTEEQPSTEQTYVIADPALPKPVQTGGSQYQNVYQDNDITTSITGNQNVVTNTQDNSIGQSGGNFTYADDYARGLRDRYVLNLTNR